MADDRPDQSGKAATTRRVSLTENQKLGIAALISFGFYRHEILGTVRRVLGRKVHTTQIEGVAKRYHLELCTDPSAIPLPSGHSGKKAPSRQKRLTKEQKEHIAGMIAEGLCRREIAQTVSAKLGRKIHYQQLECVAKSHNLTLRKDPPRNKPAASEPG